MVGCQCGGKLLLGTFIPKDYVVYSRCILVINVIVNYPYMYVVWLFWNTVWDGVK